MPKSVNAVNIAKNTRPAVQRAPRKPPPVRNVKKPQPNIKVKNRTPLPKSNKINIIA